MRHKEGGTDEGWHAVRHVTSVGAGESSWVGDCKWRRGESRWLGQTHIMMWYEFSIPSGGKSMGESRRSGRILGLGLVACLCGNDTWGIDGELFPGSEERWRRAGRVTSKNDDEGARQNQVHSSNQLNDSKHLHDERPIRYFEFISTVCYVNTFNRKTLECVRSTRIKLNRKSLSFLSWQAFISHWKTGLSLTMPATLCISHLLVLVHFHCAFLP